MFFSGMSFPSTIGEHLAASYEAPGNVNKILQLNPRGGKEQVVTRVALTSFHRMQELRSSYFEGLQSWLKSSCVYLLAGTATASALGLTGWGVYKIGKSFVEAGYGAELFAGALGIISIGWVAHALGHKPLSALSALLMFTIRDAANRAAQSSTRQDERHWKAKQKEIQECHKEIFSQSLAVFNDCAKYLRERFEASVFDAAQQLELAQTAKRLEEKLPILESSLKKFGLSKPEVELTLQRLRTEVEHLRKEVCQLQPTLSAAKTNAELLALWGGPLKEIAIPYAIQHRLSTAKQDHFGILQKMSGYCMSVLAGMAVATASAAAIVGIRIVNSLFISGAVATAQKIQNFLLYQGLDPGGRGAAAFAIITPATAVAFNKVAAHHQAIRSNAEAVAQELGDCVRDLKVIYKGIGDYLERLPPNHPLFHQLRIKLPLLRNQIQKSGLVNDPTEILEDVEKALRLRSESSQR